MARLAELAEPLLLSIGWCLSKEVFLLPPVFVPHSCITVAFIHICVAIVHGLAEDKTGKATTVVAFLLP